jgi:NADH:ubiquinone oxidoreductase subunit H
MLYVARIGLLFIVVLTLAAYLVFADLIKLLAKVDFLPAATEMWLLYLAPAIAVLPVKPAVGCLFLLKIKGFLFFFISMQGVLPRLRYKTIDAS